MKAQDLIGNIRETEGLCKGLTNDIRGDVLAMVQGKHGEAFEMLLGIIERQLMPFEIRKIKMVVAGARLRLQE